MKALKCLVACERSGRVREALTKLGHDATSCDLEPTDIPGKHYQGDIREILYQYWDLVIAHPSCLRLCNSGVLRLYIRGKKVNGIDPVKWREMIEGAEFFKLFLNLECKNVAIENPVMHCHAKNIIGVSQSQIIQPYQFGHYESKATCLWLKGLPNLQPTEIMTKPERGYWDNQTPTGQNKLGGGMGYKRAITYQGIADAMASQWTNYIKQNQI